MLDLYGMLGVLSYVLLLNVAGMDFFCVEIFGVSSTEYTVFI